MILHCHGHFTLLVLYQGLDQGFHHCFVLEHYHLQYYVCCIPPLSYPSLFDYCDVVWTPTTAKLTAMLERVHSKFVNRLALSFHSKFSYTLTERRRFHKAIQVFKSLHFISPTYLHKIFFYSKDVSGYVTHNINHLFLPRVNTNFGKRSFFYSGANL